MDYKNLSVSEIVSIIENDKLSSYRGITLFIRKNYDLVYDIYTEIASKSNLNIKIMRFDGNTYINGTNVNYKHLPLSYKKIINYFSNCLRFKTKDIELSDNQIEKLDNVSLLGYNSETEAMTAICRELKINKDTNITNIDYVIEKMGYDTCECSFYKHIEDDMCVPCESYECGVCGSLIHHDDIIYDRDTIFCENCVNDDDEEDY